MLMIKITKAFQLIALFSLATLLSGCNQYDPYHPDTSNREGIWMIDNSYSRKIDQEPVWKRLSIYATHMEFCPGQGTVGTEGQWRDNGFWCKVPGSSEEYEAAKILPDDQLELRLSAFYPGSNEILTLFKREGTEEEKKAIADQYPPPLLNPPPKGIFTVGMTEYQVQSLPWKPTISRLQDDAEAERLFADYHIDKTPDVIGTLYTYPSTDPHLTDLKVLVKDHHVISVQGGNE